MLDLLYAQAAATRRRWYERHPEARRRLRQPVISVGNLSVGGTGKTPLVAQIARWLVVRGERPAILSRGYGRQDRRDGVVVVSDGAVGSMPLARLESAGDEPLMLAYGIPGAIVAVAEDRYLAGVLAERRLGATVHVLDDGFQHVQLARDFDVLMTMEGEIAGGRPLPFGRLRESKAAAARADFVVVLDADSAAAKSEAWALGISQASAARRAMARAESGAGAARAVAVAGIARPEQFFAMLRDAGYDVASTMPFRDHHRYSASDIARIAAEAQSAGGVVLTTEKDEVRLRARAPLPFTCRAVPMTIEVDAWDALCESMEAAMARRRDELRC